MNRRRFPWLSYLVVVSGAVLTVVPFLDMVMTSFKGPGEAGTLPYRFLPKRSTCPTTGRRSTSSICRCSSATASSPPP